MNRVFGVRAIALGLGYLLAGGEEERRRWRRLWLLCDGADTAMGLGMVARGDLKGITAVEALAITGAATAIDVAAIAAEGAATGSAGGATAAQREPASAST